VARSVREHALPTAPLLGRAFLNDLGSRDKPARRFVSGVHDLFERMQGVICNRPELGLRGRHRPAGWVLGGGETILLVEDNPDVVRLQSRQFPAHAGDAQADQGLVAINPTRGRALTGPSAAVW
jgi:hypothetical protein